MITSRNKRIKSIIDSRNGIHVTVYLKFNGNPIQLRKTLRNLLFTAEAHLDPVMCQEEIEHFLAPARALACDTASLEQIRGNIALFRKNGFFCYLSIPIDIEDACVVASTFHIKPLLKWAQQDQDFMVIAVATDRARLYTGNQTDFRKINEFVYPNALQGLARAESSADSPDFRKIFPIETSMMEWLSEQLERESMARDTKLFIAGDTRLAAELMRFMNHRSFHPENVSPECNGDRISDLCGAIRSILQKDSRTRLEGALKEFELAQNSHKTRSNIFLIAKAAASGNIKRLLIAEDLNVFGRLDLVTENLLLHPADMDHEDDCLLDDLAQTVLLSGGEVVIAKRSEIPQGRPVIAVLNHQMTNLEDGTSHTREIAL
jgi:hypothetical protein